MTVATAVTRATGARPPKAAAPAAGLVSPEPNAAWQQISWRSGADSPGPTAAAGHGDGTIRRKCDCGPADCGCGGTESEVVRRSAGPTSPAGMEELDTGIHAKLTMTAPDHPDEAEADRHADAFVRRQARPAPPGMSSGSDDEDRVRRKARHGGRHEPAHALAGLSGSQGTALAPGVRQPFERFFESDLAHVRIHDGPPAARAAEAIGAHAFTRGSDVYFNHGRFAPGSTEGQRLLAHELAHTFQGTGAIRRDPKPASAPASADPSTDASLPAAEAVAEAVKRNDLAAVVDGLAGQSIQDLKIIRATVLRSGTRLEKWLLRPQERAAWGKLAGRIAAVAIAPVVPLAAPFVASGVQGAVGGNASDAQKGELGLRRLWPALSLMDQLEVYDEAHRELEQAQLDVIKGAKQADRDEAAKDPRLKTVYARMSPTEEYEARLLISPNQRYEAVCQLVDRAPGFIDEEDPVFTAILDLKPSERKALFNTTRVLAIRRMLSGAQFKILETIVRGTEAQAVLARLRLATEDRIDDKEGIQKAVARAKELIAEKRQLTLQLGALKESSEDRKTVEARIAEIGDLESLLKFTQKDGKIDPASFMGRLADASDPDEFGRFALSLGADPFETARQRILLAAGTVSIDAEAIERAIFAVQAPAVAGTETMLPKEREEAQTKANNTLRQKVLADPQVAAVMQRLRHQGPTGGMDVNRIEMAAQSTRLMELLSEFNAAVLRADWGNVFRLALVFSKEPVWKAALEDTKRGGVRAALNAYSRIPAKPRQIVDDIVATGRMPLQSVLEFTGDAEVLRIALGQLDEGTRGRLRLGYLLSRQGKTPADPQDAAALEDFRKIEALLRKKQAPLDIEKLGVRPAGAQDALDALLGGEPTADETGSPIGRYRAAAIMYHRQQERLGIGRGASEHFSETDETMVAAARAFGALWEQVKDRKELDEVTFSKLSALHERFLSRTQEWRQADNAAGEIAGMVAATVAGILVVVASGGAATPAVVALAAAAGAGSRVAARELFGGDYYDPVSEAGGRDAVLGAVDGALAVLGTALAARGAQMLGLGGHALTKGAARMGGELAEGVSQSFAKKVAGSAVEAALDGLFSGAVSEAAGAITDARTWRQGAWKGIVRVGEAALVGGTTGLVGGAVVGGALPVLARGAKAAWTGIFSQGAEQALARAGKSETLAAARMAARKGEYDEARRLFKELEGHLEGAQANALWRELGSLHPGTVRIEVPVELASGSHTLKLVETPTGPIFVLCSWCTKVRDLIDQVLADAERAGAAAERLKTLREKVGAIESSIAAKTASEDSKTMRQLLGILSEIDHLAPPRLPARAALADFSAIASDGTVAKRAHDLYPSYYEQLWDARREIFTSKKVQEDLNKWVQDEARSRALAQAQREIHPGGLDRDLGGGVKGIDPGGRGIYSLADEKIATLPPADAVRLRNLQSRMPATQGELAELCALRKRAAGGDLPLTPGTPEHMQARWDAYSGPPPLGDQSFQRWAAGHPSRMRNSKSGIAAEGRYATALEEAGIKEGVSGGVVRTPGGKTRQVDLIVDRGVEGRDLIQIKSGKESLTTQPRQSGGTRRGASSHSNKEALALDAELAAVPKGHKEAKTRVIWVFEQTPSGPLVAQARKSNVTVIIRVDDAAEKARAIANMRAAGMSKAEIASVQFVPGTVDDAVKYVAKHYGAK
jgi:hypothetical protein